jgi:tetratricopeptide (TPR) repeat protein
MNALAISLATLAILSVPGPPAALASVPSIRISEVDSLLAAHRYAAADSLSAAAIGRLESGPAGDTLRVQLLDRRLKARLDGGRSALAETQALASEAVRAKEALFGAASGEVARTINTQGWILYKAGRWEEATPIVERGLSIARSAYGERHIEYLRAIHLLGALSEDAGAFERADSLYHQELAIERVLFGDESVQVANTLNSMGILCRKTARYDEGRPLFERAVALREKKLGPDHPDVGWALNNEANLLIDIGEWSDARDRYTRALAIWEKCYGPAHPTVGSGYSNLGNALFLLGDTLGAERSYRHALEILEKTEGPDHPDVSLPLLGLGEIAAGRGDSAAARGSIERAVGIRVRSYGEGSVPAAIARMTLGDAELRSGEFSASARDYAASRDVYLKLGLTEHERVAEAGAGIAAAEHGAGRDSAAFEAAIATEALVHERVQRTARVLDERLALGYADTRDHASNIAIAIASTLPPNRARIETAWDALVRARAQILDELGNRHHAVETGGDPRSKALADSLALLRERLARCLIVGPEPDHLRPWQERFAALSTETERVESALAERSSSFRRDRAEESAGLERARAALSPGDALIAYATFTENPWSREARTTYVAFVARDSVLACVCLGSATAVERDAEAFRSACAARPGPIGGVSAEAACRAAGTALRRIVWDPIVPLLGHAPRVFLVPDGDLSLVDFAAFPIGADSYLIEGPMRLIRLSAERDLAAVYESTHNRGLLAFGNPDFGAIEGPRSSFLARGSSADSTGADVSRGGRLPPCADFRDRIFDPLPGTQAEVHAIADLWKSSHASQTEPVTVRLDRDADEGSLKTLARGERAIHVATHAFMLDKDCGRDMRPISDNPLLLSGLALAGANERDRDTGRPEDGILTAEEAASLDFEGVEWVVLSACETGVGAVHGGEGVLGLQRAFRIAGARNLILSLWRLDDVVSERWMRMFYSARLEHGAGSAEAVGLADLGMLRECRARGIDTHPGRWAGFISVGDWR